MESPYTWPTGTRHPLKGWWSACILSSHCYRPPTERPLSPSSTAVSTSSSERVGHPRWSNSSTSHQVAKQVLTTTVTLTSLSYADLPSTSGTITLSTSADSGGEDTLTPDIASSVDATSTTPSTHLREPTQDDASSPLSSTPPSVPSPPTTITKETTLQSYTPPLSPATSSTLSAVLSTSAQATGTPAVPVETQSPGLTEFVAPVTVTDPPPASDDNIAEPRPAAAATPAIETTVVPALISLVGSPQLSASPVALITAPSETGTDVTMTPTSAQTTQASSTSDLCLTNPLDPHCPLLPATVTQSPSPQQVDPALCGIAGGAQRICPTTSTISIPYITPGTTGDIIVSDGHVTSLVHSSTMSTSSATCEGNSDSCNCLSGTCHTQTTLATKTLVSDGSASGPITTTSSPTSGPSPTSAPSNDTVTTHHARANVLPIAIGVAIPIALLFLLLGILYLWRRIHRKSYNVYSSHCPFHNAYRGISAILARWKLTRQRNRSARARGYSAGADTAPLSEKYSIDTYRGVSDGISVPREGDAAANPLARWRRAQQDRLAQLQGKQEGEMSAEAAETLRRYEIERAKRLKDFGVRAMSPEVKESVFGGGSGDKGREGRRDMEKVDGGKQKGRGGDAVDEVRVASPSSRTLGGSTQRGSSASDDNWL